MRGRTIAAGPRYFEIGPTLCLPTRSGMPVLQRAQQFPGRSGDLLNGFLKGVQVCLRWMAIAADLPHELEGRRPDVAVRWRGVGSPQHLNAPAHNSPLFAKVGLNALWLRASIPGGSPGPQRIAVRRIHAWADTAYPWAGDSPAACDV